jgi:hypothetical protein
MFELFSDMYFIVYKLYYVGQNDDLGMRVRLRNWDGGSIVDFFQNHYGPNKPALRGYIDSHLMP